MKASLPAGDPIDEAAIRTHLERVLASSGFSGSARLRRFLSYVVEQRLLGNGAQLKEYAIGVEVFDRQAHYDPRLDSIVRVEAGRLRKRLDEYYSAQGLNDDVRILLPRGSYVPVFARRGVERVTAVAEPRTIVPTRSETRRSARATAIVTLAGALLAVGIVAGWRSLSTSSPAGSAPSIAVLPLEHYSASDDDARLAAQLTDEITLALARLGRLSVVSRTSARRFEGTRQPMHEVAAALNANVIMEAALEFENGRILIQPRLVDGGIDRKFWVGEYRGDRDDVPELATRIAAGVADATLAHR